MTDVLDYKHFGAHGGDWGSTITEQLARSHPNSLLGIHMTDVPFAHLFQKPKDPSRAEAEFFKRADRWQQEEGAYAMIQSTRPTSLAVGLDDSPAGLAAWMVEKFQSWSDCNGDVESRFSKDELLTHITLYWITRTIHSSFWLYYDAAHASKLAWIREGIKQWTGPPRVPTGFASFPKDLLPPPREWAARFFDIHRWTEMPRGGHFAALEEPQLLASELREFFRPLR
jgi:pimeloyl-ACP methyl ester carboxylesterase